MSLFCLKLPQKTAGILGGDLALNAEQVNGVKAELQLPVASFLGCGKRLFYKETYSGACCIIDKRIFAIVNCGFVSDWWLIPCFEGGEKIARKFMYTNYDLEQEHIQKFAVVADPCVELVALEKNKIKGAIRTNFILSAEIVVILISTVQDEPFATQVAVLWSAFWFCLLPLGCIA
jgi:predicted DNA repair protein MutK